MVDESMLRAVQNRANTAATIMSTDDDVFDPKRLYCELQNRHAIEVCRIDDIRDVSMHEDLARLQASNCIRGHPTVRTTDPQELGSLQAG
jgi:hypothetical protein